MSRFEWILGGGLAAALVAAALAAFLFRQPSVPAASAGVTVAGGSTAQSSYEQAAPVAARWAGDAQLLTARATWPPAKVFPPEAASWDYVFYSPGKSATALVSVVGDTSTFITTRESKHPQFPGGLDGWQVDSSKAVQQLLAQGGELFLQDVDNATLVLTLSTDQGLVWNGMLINTQAKRTLNLRIDATTGETMEIRQAQ